MAHKPQSERSAKRRKPWHRFAGRLTDDRLRFAVLCFFVASVFAMGGGSRADILSLPVLRPIAFLVAGYAFLVARPGELRAVSWPLILLGCLLAVIALQLLPLPPSVWPMLPGRDLYLQIANDAGLPPVYRPLTLSPSRTLNAFFSLSVPFAAILITAVQSERYRSRIFSVLLIACGVSALVAVGQVAGPDRGGLYLYRITNEGFPVGLLANRNHQALLMAVSLILIADFRGRAQRAGKVSSLSDIGMALAALVAIALVIVSGSRAGLLLALVAIPLSARMLAKGSGGAGASRPAVNRAWWAASIGGIIGLVGAAIALARATSIDRLRTDDPLSDIRLDRLPILVDMLGNHWLFGIGFGAFEGAYKRYSTVEVLTPFIFNQAHNDWIQFPMEGGLAAVALLFIVLVWLSAQAVRVLRKSHKGSDGTRFTALVILGLIGLASVVDYPLRTPIFMLVGAVAFTALARRSGPSGSARSQL